MPLVSIANPKQSLVSQESKIKQKRSSKQIIQQKFKDY